MIVNLLLNEVNKKDVFTLMTATTKELFIHASMRDSRFYLTSKGLMDGGLKSETNFNLGEVWDICFPLFLNFYYTVETKLFFI